VHYCCYSRLCQYKRLAFS